MTVSITRFQKTILVLMPVFLSFFAQSLYAANPGTVKGRVLDKETGAALPGATVIVENTSIGAATDPDGKFTIHGVPSGAQRIKVSYLGYQSITVDVTVPEDGDLVQDFKLTAQAL